MSIGKEFKEFIARGNVIDLAVGVVIGGAFGKIVTSFLNDVMMPPLGMMTGGVDFTEHRWTLKPAHDAAPVPTSQELLDGVELINDALVRAVMARSASRVAA